MSFVPGVECCPHPRSLFSLDRLLLLLDTGSSSSVRNTAAKQLAQLAARSLIDDFSSLRQHASIADTSAWSELLAVVARVSFSVFAPLLRVIDPSPRYYHFYIQRAMTPDPPPLMPSHKYSLSYPSGIPSPSISSPRRTFRSPLLNSPLSPSRS